MLGFIFGLNARLGRLHYFLSTLVLAVVMAVLCFLVVMSLYHTVPHGTPMSLATMKWPLIGLGALFFGASFTLQSMRIRDIGWDPVCVIPTWLAIMMVDMVVARKFPGLSLGGEHYGTAVGALVNLAMSLALLFWPGGDYDDSAPDISEPRQRPDPSPRGGTPSVASARIARASGEFGRRAL